MQNEVRQAQSTLLSLVRSASLIFSITVCSVGPIDLLLRGVPNLATAAKSGGIGKFSEGANPRTAIAVELC